MESPFYKTNILELSTHLGYGKSYSGPCLSHWAGAPEKAVILEEPADGEGGCQKCKSGEGMECGKPDHVATGILEPHRALRWEGGAPLPRKSHIHGSASKASTRKQGSGIRLSLISMSCNCVMINLQGPFLHEIINGQVIFYYLPSTPLSLLLESLSSLVGEQEGGLKE